MFKTVHRVFVDDCGTFELESEWNTNRDAVIRARNLRAIGERTIVESE